MTDKGIQRNAGRPFSDIVIKTMTGRFLRGRARLSEEERSRALFSLGDYIRPMSAYKSTDKALFDRTQKGRLSGPVSRYLAAGLSCAMAGNNIETEKGNKAGRGDVLHHTSRRGPVTNVNRYGPFRGSGRVDIMYIMRRCSPNVNEYGPFMRVEI